MCTCNFILKLQLHIDRSLIAALLVKMSTMLPSQAALSTTHNFALHINFIHIKGNSNYITLQQNIFVIDLLIILRVFYSIRTDVSDAVSIYRFCHSYDAQASFQQVSLLLKLKSLLWHLVENVKHKAVMLKDQFFGHNLYYIHHQNCIQKYSIHFICQRNARYIQITIYTLLLQFFMLSHPYHELSVSTQSVAI